MFVHLKGHKYSYTPLLGGVHESGGWVVTFYRCEVGWNSIEPSCWVLYGESKSLQEWGVNLTSSWRYWASFVLDLVSELRPNHTRETHGDGPFVHQRVAGDSRGVGFWFIHGFDPITICIEMAY